VAWWLPESVPELTGALPFFFFENFCDQQRAFFNDNNATNNYDDDSDPGIAKANTIMCLYVC